MSYISLVEPCVTYERHYIQMVEEWMSSDDKFIPGILRVDYRDFEKLVKHFEIQRERVNLEQGIVPCSTFWLVVDEKIVGVTNVRHCITPELQNIGGHIGYAIRPSERMKGYGTEILRQALIKAKSIGIDKALITCDRDNVGSIRVIENNGGVLDSAGEVNNVPILRYWVKTIS